VTKFAQHHLHFGAFLAEVEQDRAIGAKPFARDLDPPPMIAAMPGAAHAPARAARSMVREGRLKSGPGSSAGRGREPFAPMAWQCALDLVATGLAPVRRKHGNAAIMGGPDGWGFPGIFHQARTQVRRFLAAFGGFVDQATNSRFAVTAHG